MVELAVFRLIRRLGGLWIVFPWFRGVFRRFCMIFHRFRTFRVLERTHLMTNSGQKYKSLKRCAYRAACVALSYNLPQIEVPNVGYLMNGPILEPSKPPKIDHSENVLEAI